MLRRRIVTASCLAICLLLCCGFKLKLKGLKLRGADSSRASAATPAPRAEDPKAAGGLCEGKNGIGICYLFTGLKNAEKKTQNGNRMACKFMKGRFQENATCPTEGRLGKCAILSGSPEEYWLVYYAGKNFDAGKASSDCANAKSGLHRHGAGTWTAGG